MKKMELRDMRSERSFEQDRKLLHRAKFKSIAEYYREFATPANVCLLALTLVSVIFFLGMREVSKYVSGSTAVSCLYLTAYSMLILTPVITVLQILSAGFKPFVYSYYKATLLIHELLSANSYADMSVIFADVDASELRVLRNSSVINDIRIWCSESRFADTIGDADIKRVQTNATAVKVYFNEDDFAVLPFAKRVRGEEPALILTDAGVVLQLAA